MFKMLADLLTPDLFFYVPFGIYVLYSCTRIFHHIRILARGAP